MSFTRKSSESYVDRRYFQEYNVYVKIAYTKHGNKKNNDDIEKLKWRP